MRKLCHLLYFANENLKIDKNSVILIKSYSDAEVDPDGNGKKIKNESKSNYGIKIIK